MKGCMIRKNFTLIEIVTVLGLMAILLFIALPAFEKLAKGHGVELAARNLTSKLGQARGYAITSREYVALLMPTADTTNASGSLVLPDHAFKGYKLCVVSSVPTSSTRTSTLGIPPTPVTTTVNTFTFKRWLPSEKWEFLPNGTSINHIISGSAHAVGTDSNSWAAASTCEEVSGVSLKELNPPSSTTYDSVNNVRAIVFRPTGKMVVTGNRYVAVSESTYNGTTLTATNPKNWIDITVDQFTGRVTYGSE
jgi:hypothetical protein